jgi:hypothetical protein
MTFTLVPITRTYLDGSGNPRTGTVRLQLVGVLTNNGEIADRRPYSATLDAQGKISLSVPATNDPDTLPVGGGTYEVTETLSGLATATYFIAVPYDGGPIDLATAPRLAQALAPGIFFQPINQRGLPNGYAILDGSGRVPYSQLPTDIGSGGGGGGGATPISGDDTDIQSLGVRAAGASGKAADARHVHQMPLLHQVGKPTSDVDLNGRRITNAADGINPQDYATVAQLGQSVLGWFNVKDKQYGAKGDGTTDDTAAIQAAIDACPAGGVVYLPQGIYRTSSTLYPKPGIVIQGAHASLMSGVNLTDPPCYIQPLTSFTGNALITFKDQASGGYANLPAEHRLNDIMLDGSTLDGTKPVDGIYAAGNIQNVVMRNVTIRKMSNNGIVTAGIDNVFPYSWRLHSVMIDNCRGNGMLITRMTDLTMIDCQAIGCWATGFKFTNIANSTLSVCRAEWNGNHGFWLTGSWGNAAGSGGAILSACSTDRNGWDGVHVDATGNGPLTISALTTRRDGRNGGSGGGGYAGLAIKNATLPVVVDGVTCYTSTDDDGTGAPSPDYGASITGNTSVQLSVGYLHGFLGGLHDDNTNASLVLTPGVTLVSGPTTNPARTVKPSPTDWINAKDPKYGARGDGVTDDTAALQAAVSAAAALKTTLYIPNGTYIVSTPVVLPAGEGYSIVGSGWGTSLKLKAASNCFILKMTGADTRVTIRDLTLDGNCLEQGATGTSGGIDGSGAVACRIDNVHFTACRDDGLYLAGQTGGAFGHNNRIIGCLFDQSMTSTGPGRGIQMNSNDENQIIGCDFEFLGGSGGTGADTAVCILDKAGTQFISDCNFVGGATNNTKGVRLQDCSATKIEGCNFDGTAGDSIFVAATGNVIVGNTIFSPGEVGTLSGQVSGIHLEYATKNNLISANSIASSPTNGKTRSLIREEATGSAGPNLITNNVLITKGTLAVAATEFAGAGSITTPNLGV